ncbi:hypothetical protein BH10PSE7_BH10PSE7_04210 [soil metagenome]
MIALTLGLAAMPRVSQAGEHYDVALISGGLVNGSWRAGLVIDLEVGWKTYWRVPGEAGIPPEFNWSKSQNLGGVDVFWPAPKRYRDAGGEAIGYHDQVVFPLRVKAKDQEKPVTLTLDLFFAVCKDICLPVTVHASLAQPAASPDPAEADLIAAFAARVPVPVDSASAGRVTAATVDEINGGPALRLEFAGDIWSDAFDIFVEGGGLAYFRAPRRGASAREVYLPIDGLKRRDDLGGKSLLLTLVSGDTRLEQSVSVT